MTEDTAVSAAFAELQGNSLAMLVQREIERMVVAGELSAGEKLNENTLASRFGISRGPVREAFRTLEGAGLLRVKKNQGVFVRELSVEEAAEIYELRASLLELAGRRQALCITPAQLDELTALLDAMDRAAARDVEAYYPLNLKFHDRLVEFSGNRKLASAYRQLIRELHLFRKRGLVQDGGLLASSNEHRQIVANLAAGDAPAAGKAMYDHVMSGRERMLQAESNTPRPEA
jgi:phosphonate utilization transcriptional regulator